MSNQDQFLTTYKRHLKDCHKENEHWYDWPIEEFERVSSRMTAAIVRNGFNKETIPFKRTCKELKIKHTYKAIKAYITEES